jgi:hypothetical protein
VYIAVVSVAVMQKYCEARFHGGYYFRSDFSAFQAANVSVASTVVDRKSMIQTVADRSSNEADFLCILLFLALRLSKSVVTLAVKGNTNCGWFFCFRGCRSFSGSDCHLPEVDETYDG